MHTYKIYGQIPSLCVEGTDSRATVYFSYKRFSYHTVPIGTLGVLYDQELHCTLNKRTLSLLCIFFLVSLHIVTVQPGPVDQYL